MGCRNPLLDLMDADRLSPPDWNGSPPIFNLMESIRYRIPFQHYLTNKMFFQRDLQTVDEQGVCHIPLCIAATMIVLQKKHEAELCSGVEYSFLYKLDYPYSPSSACEFGLDRMAECLIYESKTLEDVERKLETYPARYVFEVLVELIQRCDGIKVKFSVNPLKYCSELNLISKPEKLELFACPEEETAFQERIMNAQVENSLFRGKIMNFIHYEFNKDLNHMDNQCVAVCFRFIITNLIAILRRFYATAANTSIVKDDKQLLINYTNVHRESMLSIMKVMGCKLSRYLICLSPTFIQCYFGDKTNCTRELHAITDKVLINILLLNTIEAWYKDACLREYVQHSIPTCNFDEPNCSCALLLQTYQLPGCLQMDAL